MPIEYVTGDATAPRGDGNAIICHVCNDVGGWGKGFVVAISKRWREPETAYRAWFAGRANNDFGLGGVQLVQVEPTVWVANMVAQAGLHPKEGLPPIRYEAVSACLAKVGVHAEKHAASLHMPRIGCGLAGGKWEQIEPLIEAELLSRGLRVWVYDLERARA
jgi:O-acetyl-ADP-ribose deacetylase (regulator of RNase III)